MLIEVNGEFECMRWKAGTRVRLNEVSRRGAVARGSVGTGHMSSTSAVTVMVSGRRARAEQSSSPVEYEAGLCRRPHLSVRENRRSWLQSERHDGGSCDRCGNVEHGRCPRTESSGEVGVGPSKARIQRRMTVVGGS